MWGKFVYYNSWRHSSCYNTEWRPLYVIALNLAGMERHLFNADNIIVCFLFIIYTFFSTGIKCSKTRFRFFSCILIDWFKLQIEAHLLLHLGLEHAVMCQEIDYEIILFIINSVFFIYFFPDTVLSGRCRHINWEATKRVIKALTAALVQKFWF